MATAKKYTDRDYMMEAIEEMRLSRDDHSDRPDPMVGAVLVKKGDEGKKPAAKAHRGMLRVGDHAEFTLLERLLPHEDLEGATLYVTLEPCTERNEPKKPCSHRVARARIGKVFIGIVDPNPDIEGQGVAYLESQGIEVKFFDSDLAKEIRAINEDFIRHWEEQKKKPKPVKVEVPSEFERQPVANTSEKNLDEQIIRKYLQEAGRNFQVPSDELWQFMSHKGFLHLDANTNKYAVTNAGMLLFGKKPNDVFPHATVKVEVDKKGNLKAVKPDEIKGSILEQPEKVLAFLNKEMEFFTDIKGLKRQDRVPEYPVEAIREVLLNAVVHRDYKDKAGSIQVSLLKGKLVVKSPGLPMPPITVEDFKKFNVNSYRRNPHIGEAFKTMRLIEERGWGLKKMQQLLKENKLPEPVFSTEGNYFVVTFLGREYQEAQGLNMDTKEIFVFIKDKGETTTKEVMEKFNLNEKTAQRKLNALIKEGLMEKIGEARSVKYRAK